jgi:hypothetical protein
VAKVPGDKDKIQDAGWSSKWLEDDWNDNIDIPKEWTAETLEDELLEASDANLKLLDSPLQRRQASSISSSTVPPSNNKNTFRIDVLKHSSSSF